MKELGTSNVPNLSIPCIYGGTEQIHSLKNKQGTPTCTEIGGTSNLLETASAEGLLIMTILK